MQLLLDAIRLSMQCRLPDTGRWFCLEAANTPRLKCKTRDKSKTTWQLYASLLAVVCQLAGCSTETTSQKPVIGSMSRTEGVSDFRKLPPDVDPEHRTEPLGDSANDDRVDTSAFAGMPEEYSDRVSAYVEAVISAIGAEPLSRDRYYCPHTPETSVRLHGTTIRVFPDVAEPVFDRKVIVQLTLLPRPESVDAWIKSEKSQELDWRPIDKAFRQVTSAYGSTVIFSAGELSREPHGTPAAPLGTGNPSPLDFGPIQSANMPFFVSIGKLVRQPSFTEGKVPYDVALELRLGENGGATRLCELRTVPVYLKNTRLRWVRTETETDTREFLAYALVDGNGARRANVTLKYGGGRVSPYLRPLACEQHQPRIRQHDLLLMPTPIRWPTEFRDLNVHLDAHEEWCFDDWFPAQPEACWVIREAEDSKPLQESFLFMPAEEASDRPAFFVALFAETEPERLVKEISALHLVSPDKILSSAEAMARLQELYENVRTFDLRNK